MLQNAFGVLGNKLWVLSRRLFQLLEQCIQWGFDALPKLVVGLRQLLLHTVDRFGLNPLQLPIEPRIIADVLAKHPLGFIAFTQTLSGLAGLQQILLVLSIYLQVTSSADRWNLPLEFILTTLN